MKRLSKIISAVMLAALFVLFTGLTVSANDVLATTTTGPLTGPVHVVGGPALSQDETAKLEALAIETSEKTDSGIYVVFSDENVSDTEAAAKTELQWIFSNGGGGGENRDCILMYVNLSTGKYSIVEDSEAHTYRLTDKFVNKQTAEDSKIASQLAKAKYADAAKTFIQNVQNELKPNFLKVLLWRLLAALGIGGAATGIAVGSHKALPKTKKRHYLKDQKIQVLEKNERLEGTNVTRNTSAKSAAAQSTDHELEGGGHGATGTFKKE